MTSKGALKNEPAASVTAEDAKDAKVFWLLLGVLGG
jgi:hypothetical protein